MLDKVNPYPDDRWVWTSYPSDGDGEAKARPGVFTDVEDQTRTPLRLELEGECFALCPDRHGGTHYTWLSGPNAGYGFSVSPTWDTLDDHRENIRDFLSQIDPATGYIQDD